MHLNVLHVIFNVLALTPLLERFESEFGTLVTLALFTGRKHIRGPLKGQHTDLRIAFGLLPGGIYTLLEKFVLRRNTVVMGARYGTCHEKDTRANIILVYGCSCCFPPKP
jgi:hypothetical protein